VTTRGAWLRAGKPLATHGGCGIMLGHGIGKILLAAMLGGTTAGYQI